MQILWSSFEEFAAAIVPQWVKRSHFSHVQSKTAFENMQDLTGAFDRCSQSLSRLSDLGFKNGDRTLIDESNAKEALPECLEMVHYGEVMLLLHKRLAKSHWANDFISERDIMKDFDGMTVKMLTVGEISTLQSAAIEFLRGYQQILMDDGEFLTNDLSLPEHFAQDFVTARNLFSVGFEEAGFLFAGRGLEAVLRAFASIKQLALMQQGKPKPAAEADFRDLVEIFVRARWRKDKSPIIDINTRNVLHLVRSTRNAVAHPTKQHGEPTWRELALVASYKAAALWKDAQRKRAGLVSKQIIKDW